MKFNDINWSFIAVVTFVVGVWAGVAWVIYHGVTTVH
jgi:hypothetical protein